MQTSHLFVLNLIGVLCAYKSGSVAVLIVPTLVLFPPSNCPHMLAHSEMTCNSTHGKNSKKYGMHNYIAYSTSLACHGTYTHSNQWVSRFRGSQNWTKLVKGRHAYLSIMKPVCTLGYLLHVFLPQNGSIHTCMYGVPTWTESEITGYHRQFSV